VLDEQTATRLIEVAAASDGVAPQG